MKQLRQLGLGLALGAVPLCALVFMARPLYPFIEDDAFISLRYAQRLLDGYGLSWTDGKPVEGYSNLLWVLLSAVLGALGMDLVVAVRVLGVASVVLILWALFRLQPLRGAGAAWPALLASVWLCLSGPIAMWSIGGLEQPLVLAWLLVTLVDVAAVCGPPGWVVYRHASLRDVRQSDSATAPSATSRRRPYLAAVSLLLLGWTRPDSPIFVVAAALVLLVMAPGTWRDRVTSAAIVAAIPATGFFLQLGFRWVYYDALVPNTALIKVSWPPDRFAGGVAYVKTGLRYLWPLVVGGGVGAVLGLVKARTRAVTVLQLVWVAAWTGYVIIIGGDHFPGHRHLLLVVGLCGLLMAQGLRLLFAYQSWVAWAAVMISIAGLPGFVELQKRDPDYRVGELVRWQWDGQPLGEMMARAAGSRRPLWAVDAAGAIPFFSHLPALDLLGLNDAHIARQPANPRFMVSHDHGDGRYVLDRKPDLITFGLPGGGPPKFLSGDQMKRDPRFARQYRPVTLGTLRPHIMESLTYVRLDGIFGIKRHQTYVVYPAYLLQGPIVSTATTDDALGAWLPANQRVITEKLDLSAGSWTLSLVPRNPLLSIDVVVLRGTVQVRQASEPTLYVGKSASVRIGIRSGIETELTTLVLQRTSNRADGLAVSLNKGETLLMREGVKVDLARASADLQIAFDNLPVNWTREGEAMALADGTLERQQVVSGHVGRLLNTYHSQFGDQQMGSLRSPKLTVPPRAALRMRVGGGHASDYVRQVGVGMYVDGKLVHVTSGNNTETLIEHTLDLSPYVGQSLELEIFDHSKGFFGHVLVDEMVLLRNAWHEVPEPLSTVEIFHSIPPE